MNRVTVLCFRPILKVLKSFYTWFNWPTSGDGISRRRTTFCRAASEHDLCEYLRL